MTKKTTTPHPQRRQMASDVVRHMAEFYADPANEAEYRAWLKAGRPEAVRGAREEATTDVA